MNFYHRCKRHENTTILVDFYKLRFFDANLCALLSAIIHKLSKENNLAFTTDTKYLQEEFDVLCRNGFIKCIPPIPDTQQSTVAFRAFEPKDKDSFFDYIFNDLMQHRGMPELAADLQQNIIEDLTELFANYDYHSKSKDLFFICGQLFPKTKYLKLTLVDLGDGFLPSINKATQGLVNTDEQAILWALEGKSTKPIEERVPGGLGIRGIRQFVGYNKGVFDIISGDAYWSTAISESISPNRCIQLDKTFCGTTINLFFNCN